MSLSTCQQQCYDGASNMLGKSLGFKMQIQKLKPWAYYMHYHSHTQPYSIKDIPKRIKIL